MIEYDFVLLFYFGYLSDVWFEFVVMVDKKLLGVLKGFVCIFGVC